ncbi:MAG: hypothetical protein KME26_18850 [Oscillatoria princeps RMCB-10]|jgi:hypothetical protein|nr:hypothetical protein [Oscillatoria princeps RMCB-10]
MFFSPLFNKYYDQISSSLLPGYKKSAGKVYMRDIQPALETINNYGFPTPAEHAQKALQSFQNRFRVTFKPLAFPEASLKEDIKAEIEPQWSSFFKAVSTLIDSQDFYKAIESSFKRRCEGTVNAVEVLARDLLLIAEIQKSYDEAFNVGKTREKLVQNLRYLSAESQQLFPRYYAEIAKLRDEVGNYSQQTVQTLTRTKQNFSAQVEQLISRERSAQSDYEQFFLGYRLLIAQQIDPICDELRTFSFRSQNLRSQFIEQLISSEDAHPQQLELLRPDLDNQFAFVLNELEQMLAVERADTQARQSIKNQGAEIQFEFFQDVAEEKQQVALREIGDSIRQSGDFPLILQQIESVQQSYFQKIQELAEVERQYLQLRQETLGSLDSPIKPLLNQLNLNSAELFGAGSSYRLLAGKLEKYVDDPTNYARLEQLAMDGMLLGISDFGQSIQNPIQVNTTLDLETLSRKLSDKIAELGIGNKVGFIQVLLDEAEQFDKPALLFFSPTPQTDRPELTGLLEVVQEGKLVYIRKLVCICPLPSHLLNPLLEGYKATFRTKSREVRQLISDPFLANKLDYDFQSHIARAMTQAKQRLRTAYLDKLKEWALEIFKSDSLEQNFFLKTLDDLIVKALDAVLGFEDTSDEPEIW